MRFENTRFQLFGASFHPSLMDNIIIPPEFKSGLVKCRVIYDEVIHLVEFQPYTIKKVGRLGLAIQDDIEYKYKFEDRSQFNDLEKSNTDYDAFLIIKNGYLTDSTWSNVVCYDGEHFYTPQYPLLKGIKREKLLHEGIIQTANIKMTDIRNFKEIHLINSMLDLFDSVISIENIC